MDFKLHHYLFLTETFQNAFTGEIVTPETIDSQIGLPASAVLGKFPVALLFRAE